MKQLTTLTILILLFVPLLALNFSVTAEEPEWILETVGQNYDVFYNSLNPSQKRWVSSPQRVQDSSGDWVDYIYKDLYEKERKYVVQCGLVAAEIYDYYIKIFSPSLSEVRVLEDFWRVFGDYADSVCSEFCLDCSRSERWV